MTEAVHRNKSMDGVLAGEVTVEDDSGREYICLVLNRITKSMETGGSKVGLDFLSHNQDIQDRFQKFCGLYNAQDKSLENISLVDDQREANSFQDADHHLKKEVEGTNNAKSNAKKQVKRRTPVGRKNCRKPKATRKSSRRRKKSVNSAVNTPTEFTADQESDTDVEDNTEIDDINRGDQKQSMESESTVDRESSNGGAEIKDDDDNDDGDEDDIPAPTCTRVKRKRKKCDRGLFEGFKTGRFDCDVCLETFPSFATVLKHHAADHSRKKYFPCRHCQKVLSCKPGWIKHNMLLHNEYAEKVDKCEFCGQTFVAPERFKKHVEVCKTFYIHECTLCGKKFTSSGEVETHTLVQHSTGEAVLKLKCSVCDEIFGSEESRETHEKCHNDPNNQCDVCQKWFLSVDACTRHKNSHKEESVGTKKEYICEYCNKVYKQGTAYHKHIQLHKNTNMGQKFECQICRKLCKSSLTYKFHMRLHLPNDEKPYKCSYCGKGFGTNKGLGIHEKTHSDEMHAFCEICGRGFKEKRLLKVHIRRAHTGERPYICEICGKSFFTSSGRREHILAMHETRNVVCELCGQVFPSRARLAVHKRKHTLTKTHVECEVCKRMFNSKQTYMTHYVTRHLTLEDVDKFPQKVHSCPTCQKLFLCANKLKTHIRTHTGQKPEMCEFCNKGFSDRANLLAHIKIHKNEKPFRCEICPKRFIHRRALRKHMESHDNEGTGTHSKEDLEKDEEQQNTEGQTGVYQYIPNSVRLYEGHTSGTSSQDSHVNVAVQYIPMQDMQVVWRESAVPNNEAQVSASQLQTVMQ